MGTISDPAERQAKRSQVLLSRRGVADRLGVSEKTVARRHLPGQVKFGRLVRYVESEIDRWIANGCPAN